MKIWNCFLFTLIEEMANSSTRLSTSCPEGGNTGTPKSCQQAMEAKAEERSEVNMPSNGYLDSSGGGGAPNEGTTEEGGAYPSLQAIRAYRIIQSKLIKTIEISHYIYLIK